MTEKILLEVILALLGLLFVMCGFIWRSHEKQHSKMEEKIEDVLKQRVICGNAFASKESMTRAWAKLNEHDEEMGELSERVTRLEATQGCGK